MFYDRAKIAGTARITKDGYFVADALVARADNIQDYLASELGLTDRGPTDIVRVFRPAAEVFHKDALASLAHRPVTLDHPADPVKATNWRDHAVGDVGDEVMRDGEFVRVPIKIMDAEAIDSIKTDRREFSLGYTAEMIPETGVHDGQPYDFVAKNFRYNHLAAVARARGGESLRIIDERNPDGVKGAIFWLKKAIALHKKHMNGTAPTTGSDGEKSQMLMMTQMENALSELETESSGKSMKMDQFTNGENTMKIKIGDAEVDATNGEAVRIAVDALNVKLADGVKALADATAKNVADAATIVAKDAEIADLTKKLADAAITPAKLADAAKEYADVQAKAKAVGVTVAADADTAAIKKAVVDAKMGDAAKEYSADHIAIAFDALTKDAKVSTNDNGVQPIGAPKIVGDAAQDLADAQAKAAEYRRNAWKTPATSVAA